MKISIETTQNVIIEYEQASIGDRMLAYIIDMLIIIAYELIMLALLSELELIDSTPIAIIFIVIPFLFYDLISEIFLDGQTVGKMARQIKVISLTGKEPNVGHYLLRWLLRPIDFGIASGGVALISAIVSAKGQRLGDMVANTCVVSTRPQADFSQTLFPEVEEAYEPQFPQVEKLIDADVRLIKAVIANYLKERESKPLQMMSAKVKELLEVETEMPHLTFLQTIVKDYHYLTAGY